MCKTRKMIRLLLSDFDYGGKYFMFHVDLAQHFHFYVRRMI